MDKLKTILRSILAEALYHLWYRWQRNWDVARDGQLLKEGISAVVSAKNEEYIIEFCLLSLIGVVDQVVCIDNGSSDRTLQKMNEFKRIHGDKIEVDIVEMPGALLGDCRNEGLKRTRHKWHLRWDADMICRTSGLEDMKSLRQKILKDDRPRTIQLPRTNLRGDFHHTRKTMPPIDPGEPILMRFGRDIEYVEDGKFDVIKVPLYYSIKRETKRYYFHCEGLKPIESLIYRRQYFEWREAYNGHTDETRPKEVEDFGVFQELWSEKQFGTTDRLSLKWRYQQDLCSRLQQVDKQIFGEYPDVLKLELVNPQARFQVVLKNGKPHARIDRHDTEMMNFMPTEDDLKWEQERLS